MDRFAALLDSNVVIAMVAEAHEHHAASVALVNDCPDRLRLAVGAHSYAEVYATLTRRSASAAFHWPAGDAWTALESVAAATALVGLSPAQTFDAVRSYAGAGGIGPRLYDRLIGQVALHYGIPRIVTWNVGHLQDLFPTLEVADPLSSCFT